MNERQTEKKRKEHSLRIARREETTPSGTDFSPLLFVVHFYIPCRHGYSGSGWGGGTPCLPSVTTSKNTL